MFTAADTARVSTTEVLIVLAVVVVIFCAYCYFIGPWGTGPLSKKMGGKET